MSAVQVIPKQRRLPLSGETRTLKYFSNSHSQGGRGAALPFSPECLCSLTMSDPR